MRGLVGVGALSNVSIWGPLSPAIIAGLVLLSAVPAQAKDENIVPEMVEPPVKEEPAFDVAFGVAFTTDYVSRGITNSDSDPALQGYIEPKVKLDDFGTAYVNVWSSNVDYGEGFRGAEIDAAGGLRPEFGNLSLDIGYVYYFYSPTHVSPEYGEIYVKADYKIEDKVSLAGRIYFAPDYSQTGDTATWVAGGAKVPLPHDFAIYGGVGYQFFENPDAFEQFAWTAGASWSKDSLTIDLRYWDTDLSGDECVVRSGFSNGCDSRVVLTVSIDGSWSDWFAKK